MDNRIAESYESQNLLDVLQYRAVKQHDRQALAFLADGEEEEASVTYRELDLKARAIGARLQGVATPGDRALLLYPPGLEYVSGFLGCLYAGLIAVPAYPPRANRPDARIEAIVSDAHATVALTTAPFYAKIDRIVSVNHVLSGLQWIATDEINDEAATEWRMPTVSKETIAFIQYTSGSTGTPKGVMVSYGNLAHNLRLIAHGFGHTPNSVGVIWLPPYHDMGLIGGILQPLYVGFPCTLMSPTSFLQRPLRWLQAISRVKATVSGGPNFAFDLCVHSIPYEQRVGLDLSSWSVAFNGAEAVRANSLDQFVHEFGPFGFRREAFYPCYGLAESTLIVSGGRADEAPIVRSVRSDALRQNQVTSIHEGIEGGQALVSCGWPLLEQRVIIAHPESLNTCGPNQIGEIWVAGPSVAQGYWNRQQETQAAFYGYLSDTGDGPYLRTGDLGFQQDGELFITGRLNDLVIIRGRNYYPQDIEATVERCHGMLQPAGGAAFSIDVEGEERLVLVHEVIRQYRSSDFDDIVAAIRSAVSSQCELSVYAIGLVKPFTIPKTSSGKIKRQACRSAFLENTLQFVATWYWPDFVPVSTNESDHPDSKGAPVSDGAALGGQMPEEIRARIYPTERISGWIIHWLEANLGVPAKEINTDSALADLGFDTETATPMARALEEYLNLPIEPTIFWDYPTIVSLAQYLATLLQSEAGHGYSSAEINFPKRHASQHRIGASELSDDIGLDSNKLDGVPAADLAQLLIDEIGRSRRRGGTNE